MKLPPNLIRFAVTAHVEQKKVIPSFMIKCGVKFIVPVAMPELK